MSNPGASAAGPEVFAKLIPTNPKFKQITVTATTVNLAGGITKKVAEIHIGRKPEYPPECRFDDKRISSLHCTLSVDGTVLQVTDRSTNGVFVNGTRVDKKDSKSLLNGDLFSLVIPNAQHKFADVLPCYRVELAASDSQENPTQITQEAAADAEDTTTPLGDEVEEAAKSVVSSSPSADSKNGNTTTTTTAVVESTSRSKRKRDDQSQSQEQTSDEPPSKLAKTSNSSTAKETATEETVSAIAIPSALAPPLPTSSDASNAPAENEKEKEDAPPSTEGTASTSSDQKPPKTALNDQWEKLKAAYNFTDSLEDSADAHDDPLKANLTCGICSEIFYKPVSCLPCLHNFCAPCYSQWMKQSNTCPQCRQPVTEIRRNHAFVSLVESYLEQHPNRKHTEEEIKELEERNTIREESLRIKGRHRNSDDEYDDDTTGSEDSDDDLPIASRRGGMYVFPPQCRECRAPNSIDGFRCAAGQVHVRCSGCFEMMPDRPTCGRPQKCLLCNQHFCDQYWGCRAPNNQGALRALNTHRMAAIPPGCFGGNTVEREILLNYMNAKGLTVQNVFDTVCSKIESGEYKTNNVPTMHQVQHNHLCCNTCAMLIFAVLLYNYRLSIPKDQLPPEVTSRANCWYGKECRTQKHNVQHCRKLNHICEQRARNAPAAPSAGSGPSTSDVSSSL